MYNIHFNLIVTGANSYAISTHDLSIELSSILSTEVLI